MATTKIADVIVPEVLSSMASAQISNFLDFEKTHGDAATVEIVKAKARQYVESKMQQ